MKLKNVLGFVFFLTIFTASIIFYFVIQNVISIISLVILILPFSYHLRINTIRDEKNGHLWRIFIAILFCLGEAYGLFIFTSLVILLLFFEVLCPSSPILANVSIPILTQVIHGTICFVGFWAASFSTARVIINSPSPLLQFGSIGVFLSIALAYLFYISLMPKSNTDKSNKS